MPLLYSHKTTYFIINMQIIFKKLVQEILLLLLLSLQPMGFGLLYPIILGLSFSNEPDQNSQFLASLNHLLFHLSICFVVVL